MHSLRAFALLSFTAIGVACGDPAGTSEPPALITALPRALSGSEQAVIGANNAFGASLLGSVVRSRPDSNVFLSPLSASMALGMTMNGAAGVTFDEMRSALGFPPQLAAADINASYRDLIALLRGLDAKVDFRIANSIWYANEFAAAINQPFLTEAQSFFDARAAGLDFASPAAVTTINDWVKQSTNSRIDRIIDQIRPEIVMILINAIYFKGDWRDGFEPSDTRPESFTTPGGATVQVPMMHRSGKIRAAVVDGRTVVDMGYGGDAFAMTVILPRDGEQVNALAESLSATFWSSIGALPQGEVDLAMPKFRMTWEKELSDELKSLGMRQAFVDGGADFSRLSSSRGRELFIDYVKQKTFVDVNEVGTEAAAVTAVGIGVTSAPVRLTIRVDRPFVFALRERLSGTLLFLGRVVDPR
jgi:serpin B